MKLRFITLLFFEITTITLAQENLSYQKPSAEILALAEYERAPSVSMDSKKEYMLLSYRNTYKTLDDLNQEEMRLGGLRINPVTNISSSVTYINNLKIRKIAAKEETQVTGLPLNARLTNISWSPDEKKIAFTNTTNSGVELWIIDVATAAAKKITLDNLNANLGSPYIWMNDNQTLLVKVLPKNRPALINEKKELPKGPTVSVSESAKSQNRTYQDLLKNKNDEANFDALVTSELHKITILGASTLFKSAAIYAGESFSPDGNYLMLTTIQKPYSYIVPLSRFPQKSVVYDVSGIEIKQVNEVPLTEIMPKGFSSVRKGKRSMSWRADKPATLVYVEALDEGDQAQKVAYRDEVFQWNAPFNSLPTSMMKTQQRFGGITWGNDSFAIAYDSWYDTRNAKTYLLNPSNPNETPKIISDRNSQDIYSDPGNFETKKNEFGRYVIATENGNAYLIGDGHTKEGQFPFIDELNLKTLKTKRLYTSKMIDKKEDLLSIEDYKKSDVLVMIQSKNDYPN